MFSDFLFMLFMLGVSLSPLFVYLAIYLSEKKLNEINEKEIAIKKAKNSVKGFLSIYRNKYRLREILYFYFVKNLDVYSLKFSKGKIIEDLLIITTVKVEDILIPGYKDYDKYFEKYFKKQIEDYFKNNCIKYHESFEKNIDDIVDIVEKYYLYDIFSNIEKYKNIIGYGAIVNLAEDYRNENKGEKIEAIESKLMMEKVLCYIKASKETSKKLKESKDIKELSLIELIVLKLNEYAPIFNNDSVKIYRIANSFFNEELFNDFDIKDNINLEDLKNDISKIISSEVDLAFDLNNSLDLKYTKINVKKELIDSIFDIYRVYLETFNKETNNYEIVPRNILNNNMSSTIERHEFKKLKNELQGLLDDFNDDYKINEDLYTIKIKNHNKKLDDENENMTSN